MKRFFACFVSLAAVLVAGCSHDRNEDDELIGDFLNYSVGFSVTNAQTGVDLLDPEFEGNILDQPITVHYGDAEYTLLKHSEEERPETRSNAPRPLGLRLARLLMGHEGTTPIPSPWLLQFGEFSPTSDYRGEAFTIDWGNGTRIRYASTATSSGITRTNRR